MEKKDKPNNFIQNIIDKHQQNNKFGGRVHTRFPPEPNGHLHIGHAKALCLNFSIAEANNGLTNLRFDDTNPLKEEEAFVEAIIKDIKWLGFDWEDRLYFASDYFEQLYQFALELIEKNKAYVCDLSTDQIREYRGTLKTPGKNSPYRERSIAENLDLFQRMKAGEFSEASKVLRAKIDMSSSNINMRDPVIYRIIKAAHHRTKDLWCIYPMYDYAHPLSDYIEKITHSLCSLEYEDHRPLYDWFLTQLKLEEPPQQIEFARLNLSHTIMSKRKLRRLIEEGVVKGWDDPRMPTLSGLRRRGYTPQSIKNFCDDIGVAKAYSIVNIAQLEHSIRAELNYTAQRVMAVLNPLKVVLTNYPPDQTEELLAENNPEQQQAGQRKLPFSRELYIERDDFMENPPKKFFRLSPGGEIRLKHAYYIKCEAVIKDESTGEIKELHCTYDPESRGGWIEGGRKVRGTAHWVSAPQALKAEVRLFENLFLKENPEEDQDFLDNINPDSKKVLKNCMVEPSLLEATLADRFQFLRQGYFCLDQDTNSENLIFNRIVSLKDSWSKIKSKA